MFEAVVYFAGPMTTWAGKPQPLEFLARFPSRSKLLACIRAISLYRQLDAERCGWALYQDDVLVENVAATRPTTTGAGGCA